MNRKTTMPRWINPEWNKYIGAHFERWCMKFNNKGSILEIGCGPSPNPLLKMQSLKKAKYKVGINLKAYDHYKDFKVLKCNANNMRECFKDNTFDIVLCNAIFEHDKYFWKSVSEIHRVLKPGGVFILGVPGFCENSKNWKTDDKAALNKVNSLGIHMTTVTFKLHKNSGDYWRFSEQAYQEVLMEGFKLGACHAVMVPPRIIGYGIKQ